MKYKMDRNKLKKEIIKKLEELNKEFIPLQKKFFSKGSPFKDTDLDRGVWLEQRIDDLNHILNQIEIGKPLFNYHLDMLTIAGIKTNGE